MTRPPLTSTSSPRHALRAGAGVLACAALTAGLVTAPSSSALAAGADSADSADGAGSGWWYDALVVPEVHQETTGEGATVLLVDGSIDTSTAELEGSGIELTKNCLDEPMESFHIPDADHATWMASLIGGTGKGAEGPGIAGIAPDADLKYFTLDIDHNREGIDCKETAIPILEEIISGIEGGPILSLSVGNLAIGWDDFQDTVEEAGGVAVAAAGDYTDSVGGDGQMDLPAGFPGYVAVLALDQQAQPWKYNPLPYRNLGRYLHYPTISAPGEDIPGFTWTDGRLVSGAKLNGTSPATALVAGSLALVRSKYPEATGNQLIQHLIHFDTTPEKFGYSDDFGFGIISLRNMMANDPTLWPDVNPLIEGNPKRVLKRFPMSIYGQAEGDGGAAADGEQADGTASADEDSEPSTETTSEATAAADEGGSPLPWVLGGGVLLLVVAGAAVLARRGKTNA